NRAIPHHHRHKSLALEIIDREGTHSATVQIEYLGLPPAPVLAEVSEDNLLLGTATDLGGWGGDF
ncbi:hypothetical protein, partial [uncultured Thermosynechococcus sp.]|uniref:hypothetical protein n=1 Tax=uncultured Thermosynechococcus sp. TaxID=436945 RepID=UPI002608F39B